jgi:hypothetical protein
VLGELWLPQMTGCACQRLGEARWEPWLIAWESQVQARTAPLTQAGWGGGWGELLLLLPVALICWGCHASPYRGACPSQGREIPYSLCPMHQVPFP